MARELPDTQQRLIERSLAEERFRLAVEAAPTGIVLADSEGRIVLANAYAEKLFGYRRDELIGQKIEMLVPERFRERHPQFRMDYAAEPTARPMGAGRDLFALRKDGTEVPVEIGLSPVVSDQGTMVLSSIVDITERKRAEEGLRQAEERMRSVVDHVVDGIITIDERGAVQTFNPAAERIFGYTASEVIGQNVKMLMPEPYRHEHDNYLANYVRTGEAKIIGIGREVEGRRKDGSTFPLDLAVSVFQISGRRYFTGLVRDITDRKQADVRQSRLAAIVEFSRDAIISKSLNGVVASWNPGAEALMGYSAFEMIGRSINRIVPPERIGEEAEILDRIKAGQSVEHYETERVCKDGRQIPVSVTISPIRDRAGAITGASKVIRDITERKRAEDQMHLLLREVNHRSKNMLSVVLAIAHQTAQSEDFVPRFDARIAALAANQDLLVKNEWKGVLLHELMHSQLSFFKDLLGSRISSSGPTLLLSAAASQALGMALHELATNAVKYGALASPNGRVKIEWDAPLDTRGNQQFTIVWREAGGPQPAPPERRGFGSTVLTHIINSNLGADAVLDFVPTGVVWRLACPIENVLEGSTKPTARVSELTSERKQADIMPRILVVEDEALVAIEVAKALTNAGLDVIGPAKSVAEAFRQLDEHGGCDAAVLDVNLGHETAAPIAVALSHAATPFIVISGYSREQIPAMFGAGTFLAKPLDYGILVNELRNRLEQASLGKLK